MTIVESALFLFVVFLIYRALRPLRLKIEEALFNLLTSRKPASRRVIDVTDTSKPKKDETKSE